MTLVRSKQLPLWSDTSEGNEMEEGKKKYMTLASYKRRSVHVSFIRWEKQHVSHEHKKKQLTVPD